MPKLYTLSKSAVDERLLDYCARVADTISFNVKRKCYTKGGKRLRGIHRHIAIKHQPHKYKRPSRRRKTIKKGSSKQKGKRVDAILDAAVRGEKLRKNADRLARGIVKFLVKVKGHTLQASQLPVHMESIGVATQADLITKDTKGNLRGWEVKTGFPPGAHSRKWKLKGAPPSVLGGVPCNPFNLWTLQALYTHAGLEINGLKLKSFKVIHAYEEESKKRGKINVCIKERPHPKWKTKMYEHLLENVL